MAAEKKPPTRDEKWLVVISFLIAGLVAGIYAVSILSINRRIYHAFVARKISGTVEDFLRRMS